MEEESSEYVDALKKALERIDRLTRDLEASSHALEQSFNRSLAEFNKDYKRVSAELDKLDEQVARDLEKAGEELTKEG